MSYEKKEWKNGDVITADLLNRMEEGIAGGFGYSISRGVVFNDSVTTEVQDGQLFPGAIFTPSAPLGDTIEVEFNGTTYTVTGTDSPNDCKVYGASFNQDTAAYDWSEYPFIVSYCNGTCNISTETAGTYTLKITSYAITVTDEFKLAVQAAFGSSIIIPPSHIG